MDNSIIYGYFKLGNKIERAKRRFTFYDWLFWQQSFTGSPNAYDDNGNKLSMIPFDKQVDDLYSYEDLNENIIDLLQFKKHEFNKFITSLSIEDANYLKTKFKMHRKIELNQLLEQSTINECYQIEEASGYRFGYKNDVAIDLTNNYETNLSSILSVLG